MNLHEYYARYGDRITQESERLFVEEFLYPMLGGRIGDIEPQRKFLDRTGSLRRIDFAYQGPNARLALEVNGETYHAEGIIPNDMFDQNLFRQNEILSQGYELIRFSYTQLQSPQWRPLINDALREMFATFAPELLTEYSLKPTALQKEVLEAIAFYRKQGWKKGVVVLPTGTGKTILSAMDACNVGGPVLFLVHRLDILRQSIDAYKLVWPDMRVGILTGEVRENEHDCDVLFASKDTLRQPHVLAEFSHNWFKYVVVDEVHHGQSPSYREVLKHFQPAFMIGMTATPDRTDRRDIFELFDYNKLFELPLSEAIERGFLVPYTYHGLTDNVDYSQIRHDNRRYRVDDLERFLIIPERNAAILAKYQELGNGDKAIGFCVSIKHAERMAGFFNSNNIVAVAIHSESPNREKLIANFRENKIQVVFTVDLFNEGVDFPNVRVLLFLRPTESKTVFVQQLGRGLRLCSGKERVRVLDFIGNYRRANQIRKFLAKGKHEETEQDNGRTRRKIVYTYSTGCEVIFDGAVEEILNRQDAEELGITEEDLKEAYFALAEKLGRKPSRNELDSEGEFRSSQYVALFGSWVSFLREVKEYTEASYHYPQGTHLGHILSLLKAFGGGSRAGSEWDDEYVRLRGELGEGRLSSYRRQVKYKLLAAMELGILTDDRNYPAGANYQLDLTPQGTELHTVLIPVLNSLDFSVIRDDDGVPSTRLPQTEDDYNTSVRSHIEQHPESKAKVYETFLGMPAVRQMLAYLYHICRCTDVSRQQVYTQFFKAPFVRQYCDSEGIEEATDEAAKRRCPFLLNILAACGIIEARRRDVLVRRLVLFPELVRPHQHEKPDVTKRRLVQLESAWPTGENRLEPNDLSILRELFGPDFLTDRYHLKDLEIIEV